MEVAISVEVEGEEDEGRKGVAAVFAYATLIQDDGGGGEIADQDGR